MERERARHIAQIALIAIGVLASVGASWAYVDSRRPKPAPTPSGPHVGLIPSSGPAGLRPLVQLFGFPDGSEVAVWVCPTTATDVSTCASLGASKANGTFQAQAIPATLPGGVAVTPGRYALRAGPRSGGRAPVRGRFEVVPFTIGKPPKPRSYASVDAARVRLGDAIDVARSVACDVRFTPDNRLVMSGQVFDPRTAVSVDVHVRSAELAWGPRGDHLASISEDRKDLRISKPDGSDMAVLTREARGFLSSLSWAPEGDQVAFVARPDPKVRGGPSSPTVFVIHLTDGQRRTIGPGEAVAWSPRGDRLAVEAVEGGNRSVFLVTLDGKRTRLIDGRSPAWSPDGTFVAFIRPAAADAGSLWLVRPDRPDPARLIGEDVCEAAFSADGQRLALVLRPNGATRLVLRPVTSRV